MYCAQILRLSPEVYTFNSHADIRFRQIDSILTQFNLIIYYIMYYAGVVIHVYCIVYNYKYIMYIIIKYETVERMYELFKFTYRRRLS